MRRDGGVGDAASWVRGHPRGSSNPTGWRRRMWLRRIGRKPSLPERPPNHRRPQLPHTPRQGYGVLCSSSGLPPEPTVHPSAQPASLRTARCAPGRNSISPHHTSNRHVTSPAQSASVALAGQTAAREGWLASQTTALLLSRVLDCSDADAVYSRPTPFLDGTAAAIGTSEEAERVHPVHHGDLLESCFLDEPEVLCFL